MTRAGYSKLVPVAPIPAAGRRFRVEPDGEERRVMAETLGIVDLPVLTAELLVTPGAGESYTVRGELAATVVQTDVVTLEPVRQEVREAIDLTLAPAEGGRRKAPEPWQADALGAEDRELYHGGRVDLGAIVTEHLALGLDPYPRSPGAEFQGHIEDAPGGGSSSFAALAALKDGQKKKG